MHRSRGAHLSLCVNSGGTLLLMSRVGIIIHEYCIFLLTLGKPLKKKKKFKSEEKKQAFADV